MFGLWCNGSTTGFGSVCPGSNPGSPTTIQLIAAKNPLKSQVLVGFFVAFPTCPKISVHVFGGRIGGKFL